MDNVFNIVLGTTCLILLILLVRFLFWKKCNPNILYFLWIFVALRILMPVNIPFVLQNDDLNEMVHQNSLVDITVMTKESKADITKPEVIEKESIGKTTSGIDKAGKLNQKAEAVVKNLPLNKNKKFPMEKVLFFIWCCGSLGLTIYFILVNFYAFRNVEKQQAGRVKPNVKVYTVDACNCLAGVWKPCIFIDPKILENPKHKRYVLMHEMEHYKTKDNFWLLVSNLCLIIQWFNPFVWIAYCKVQEDCELACDYRVLKNLDKSEKESYAETLLHLMQIKQKKVYMVSSVVKQNETMKKRMKSIFQKKGTRQFAILLLFIAVVTFISFMKIDVTGEKKTVYVSKTDEIDNSDNTEEMTTVFVENMNDIDSRQGFAYSNCYTTDVYRGSNHYWIDENSVLWGTGTSEYGQLGELKEELSRIAEPRELAENVKHVDFSGEYFTIFITDDNKLYGMGGNPAGILRKEGRENFNNVYMNVITEPVLLMENIVFAKCGYSTIIALSENGDVYVFGNNEYVSAYNEDYKEPKKVMENARYVTSFYHTFAAISEDDSLWTWGDNRLGQCGIGSFSENLETPQEVMGDVSCAWMGRLSFNGGNVISEKDNLIVLNQDGNYFGCGEGIGTTEMKDITDDFDKLHTDDMVNVKAANSLGLIRIEEFKAVSLDSIELLCEEEELEQFLNDNKIGFYVEPSEENDWRVYCANDNKWEFVLNNQGKVIAITSTVSDEFEKAVLSYGDTLEKVIEAYGDNYQRYDGEYDYSLINYEKGDYDFRIGIFSKWGCSRFTKCTKEFDLIY